MRFKFELGVAALVLAFSLLVVPGCFQPAHAATVIATDRNAEPAIGRYSNYGIWDIMVEDLAPGPDGHWQAVVRVRDASFHRVGLVDEGVIITLFDEDGVAVQSLPNLYRASVQGGRREIALIPQTMWLEKGDEVRVRLFIADSVGFKPTRIRVWSGDRGTISRTFDLP